MQRALQTSAVDLRSFGFEVAAEEMYINSWGGGGEA